MSKVIIIYGSETGNTESIAEKMKSELVAKGHEVDCVSASDAPADNFAVDYDCVLMGASVWGIDEIELQSDFADFAENFEKMGLEGKLCAAFASGDTSYEYYCGGVDFIEGKFDDVGAKTITDGLKVEGDASDNKDAITEFVEAIHKAI